MEELELLRESVELSQHIEAYLIAAITALSAVVSYLFIAYKKSVDKQIELAKAGFELVESVKSVKDVSERNIEKLNQFELSLKDNKCIYVPPIK